MPAPTGNSLRHQLARIGNDAHHLLELLRAAERRDEFELVEECCQRLIPLGQWRPVWRTSLRYLIRSEPRAVASCRHATIADEDGWKRCTGCGVTWLAEEPPPPSPNGSPHLAQQAANLVRLLIDISKPEVSQAPPQDLEAAVGDAPLGEAILLLYTNALKVWSPKNWFEWLARHAPVAAQHIIRDVESHALGTEGSFREGPVRMWTPCPALPEVPRPTS